VRIVPAHFSLAVDPLPLEALCRFCAARPREQWLRDAFVVLLVKLGVGLGLEQFCKLYPFAEGPLLRMRSEETHNLYAVQSNPPNVLFTGND